MRWWLLLLSITCWGRSICLVFVVPAAATIVGFVAALFEEERFDGDKAKLISPGDEAVDFVGLLTIAAEVAVVP